MRRLTQEAYESLAKSFDFAAPSTPKYALGAMEVSDRTDGKTWATKHKDNYDHGEAATHHDRHRAAHRALAEASAYRYRATGALHHIATAKVHAQHAAFHAAMGDLHRAVDRGGEGVEKKYGKVQGVLRRMAQ